MIFGNDALSTLVEQGDFTGILAIALGCLTVMVAIVSTTIGSTMRSRTRENTKREIAAYVAEGSISPEQAVAMIQAGEVDPNAPNRRA